MRTKGFFLAWKYFFSKCEIMWYNNYCTFNFSRSFNENASVFACSKAAAAAELLVQRRVLSASTFLLAVAIILWLVAIFTDHWLELRPAGGASNDVTLLWTFGGPEHDVGKTNFVSGHSGLWKVCITTRTNETGKFSMFSFFSLSMDLFLGVGTVATLILLLLECSNPRRTYLTLL